MDGRIPPVLAGQAGATSLALAPEGHPAASATDLTTAAGAAVVLPDADFNDQLEDLARHIEHLERSATFRIAARIGMARELFLYRRDEGGFQGWVQTRLGWSRSKAYRYVDVDKFAKASQNWDTFRTLSPSAIFLLAASSTPQQIRDEILSRLKAGEHVSYAAVEQAITGTKQIAGPPGEKTTPPGSVGTENVATLYDWWSDRQYVEVADEASSAENAPAADVDAPEAEPDTASAGTTDQGGDVGRDAAPAVAQGDPDGADTPVVDAAPSIITPTTAAPPALAPKTTPTAAKNKTKRPSLLEAWESTQEERQIIGNLVLAEHYAQVTGADFLARLPAGRRKEVVADILDQLGVDGTLAAARDEFKKLLCTKHRSGKPKQFRTERAVETGRDASGKPIYTLQGRGGRSRDH